ncbi:hypothetical protein FCL47_20440 [Desulfopila sp. IMCC35006]|uniref:nSTAND3 domain-containing NTPase n=1 Tax=Desulfopila sp. IMCC35006 TaxID=2569542 RepID=UPI0010AB9EA5|nr:restriction endonuclease [Desulfopila sp. IMCC35006]TKB23852.1 hypothetical protein FCL47_20440 [Desulfopila sp. IMCC35006]
MNEYDFTKLNDKEFESLSVDLLSKTENKRIERFKPGKDGGVDGRFFAANGNEVVIQCKHWARSGLQALVRHIKNEELNKIKKLNPSRYILVTSIELSRNNKRIIKKMLSPFVIAENDILGKEDLNDLLSQYPEIEQKHYKLWLSSISVLRSLLNNAIIGRSTFKLEEIRDFTPKYVLTANHDQAIQKLDKVHTVIITGEPGVGKTTLADHLCLYFVLKDFELCYIEDSISEAESALQTKKKQIFYFDDFLGRNFLEALNRHEDSHVINFIKRIRNDKYKRFILTSRTTILNQGKRLSDLFLIENVDRNEFEIKISSLSYFDKAKILYNHIWFSDLSEQFIEQLYFDKRYRIIIKHHNFNPRLISFITDTHKISNLTSSEYWPFIYNTLQNPTDIWTHVFDNQIDEFSRLIVCLVVYNGRKIEEQDLKCSFSELVNSKANLAKIELIDIESCLKIIVGSLLNRTITDLGKTVYDLFNPSVGDFVLRKYSGDPASIACIMYSLNTIESLVNLNNLIKNKIIPLVTTKEIIRSLLQKKIEMTHRSSSFDYKVILLKLALDKYENTLEIENVIGTFLSNINYKQIQTNHIPSLSNLLQWGIQKNFINRNDLDLTSFLSSVLDYPIDHKDLLAICQLLHTLKIHLTDPLFKKTKKIIIESDYPSYSASFKRRRGLGFVLAAYLIKFPIIAPI